MKYMLFTGREGRIGKNCARGLEYGPQNGALHGCARIPGIVLETKGCKFQLFPVNEQCLYSRTSIIRTFFLVPIWS